MYLHKRDMIYYTIYLDATSTVDNWLPESVMIISYDTYTCHTIQYHTITKTYFRTYWLRHMSAPDYIELGVEESTDGSSRP